MSYIWESLFFVFAGNIMESAVVSSLPLYTLVILAWDACSSIGLCVKKIVTVNQFDQFQ